MQKKPCIHCHKLILEGIRFCPYCGTEQKASHTSKNYDKNPFEILQVSPGAEDEVIKAAYKSLAKKYHPDVLKNGTSEERMKELNWAYSELSDPKKKKKWEQVDYQSAKSKQEKKTGKEYTKSPEQSSDPFGEWKGSGKTEQKTYKTYEKKSPPQKRKTVSSHKSTSIHSTEYKRKWVSIGIIASLLLLSILCVVSIINDSKSNTTKKTNRSANNVENNEKAISANSAITSTPIIEEDWDLVLYERFNSNENGWFIDEDYEKDYGTDQSIIKNGRLQWSGKAFDGFVSFRSPTSRKFKDFKLSVELKKVEGEKDTCFYGVFFRNSGSGEYSFVISDRYYAFLVFHDDKLEYIIDWTYSPKIKEYGNNQLVITAIGSRFTFHINGRYITDIDDKTISEGSLGLEFGIYEEGEDAIIHFDDLKIEVPIDQTQNKVTINTNTPSFNIVGCVNVHSLNVRGGPGLNYPILDSIQYGECITIVEVTQNKEWVNSERGWLFVDYLDFKNGSIESLPIYNESNPSPEPTSFSTQPTENKKTSVTTITATNQPEPSLTNTPPHATNTYTPTTASEPTWTPACPWDDPEYPCHSTPTP